MVDFDKVLFSTLWPIDKVVYESPVYTIVNDSNSGNPQIARITTDTYTNPYGKRAFVRGRWSYDGVNWNSPGSRDTYGWVYNYNDGFFATSETLAGLKGAVSFACSDTGVVVLTGASYHGTVSDNGVTQSYSNFSQTFYVQFVLFEIE